MRFEWDEQKRKANLRKHGFDFRDAWKVFELPILIVFTKHGEDTIRIISMMKATTNERIRYEQLLRDQLGND